VVWDLGWWVSKYDGTTWTTYSRANGLASNYVYAIATDKTDNKWFVTAGGVGRLGSSAPPGTPSLQRLNVRHYP